MGRAGLMKLHYRHLEVLRSLIPSMRAYLEENLRETQHSIRSVVNDLMAAEARSMPPATPFSLLSSGGMENFAKAAVEYTLSCSDRSVRTLERFRPFC